MKGEPNEREENRIHHEEGRSLSNYIEWLINNDMKRREQEEQE